MRAIFSSGLMGKQRKSAARDVAAAIAATAQELAARIAPIQQTLPTRHIGQSFKAAVAPFVAFQRETQQLYWPRIQELGEEIGHLAGRDWQKKPKIVRLWLQLGETVLARCSEHPHPGKRVGGVLVDAHNRLVMFDANRIPPDRPNKPGYYTEGVRKNHIVCVERMIIRGVTEYGSPASQFTFVLPMSPCMECAAAITGTRLPIAGVIARAHGGRHFTRAASLQEGRKTLQNHGIPVGLYDQRRVLWQTPAL